MADLRSASLLADNYENFSINRSDAGKEFIVKLTADSGFITDAKIKEVYGYLTTNNYTASNTDGSAAGTWAGLGSADGTVIDYTADDHCFIRFQTTEAFDVTDFNAASSNVTLSIVAVFTPAA